MSVPLPRKLKSGDTGTDVEGVGRAFCKAGVFMPIKVFNAMPKFMRRKYGFRKVAACKKWQKQHKQNTDGVYDMVAHRPLEPYFDAKARALMHTKPVLVEPIQGFESLRDSLWEDFSIGRRMGLSDLGTHNPRSTAGGQPSDHASWPANAFDLGFSEIAGFATASSFFNQMMNRPELEYVIFASKIWSQNNGLRTWTGGGHSTHVHVSGRH